jgi:oligopeptide transport system substrate-binding protein
MRRPWIKFLGLLLSVTMLAGCVPGQKGAQESKTESKPSDSTQQTSSGPKKGGTFSLFMINPTSMDPHIYSYGAHIHRMALSEGLVTWKNNKFEVAPASAESWTISPDGLTYTFKIKQGLTWSNGDPLNARDFEYSLIRAIDPKTWAGAFASYQGAGILNAAQFQRGEVTADKVGVKALDDYTLEIKLDKPSNIFLMRLAEVWGLPVHKATVEKFGKDWTKPENIVTNGPFKLKSWTVNTEMVLVRNDNYKGPNPGYLDEIKLFLNPANILAYENNEVDSVEVTAADIDRVKASMGDQLISTVTGAVQGFWLMYGDNQTLMDKRVRQALAMGADLDKIAKTVSKDTVAPAWSLFPPVAGEEWTKEFAYKFDVAKAKQLLAEAGYPDGKGLPEITLLISYNIAATDPFTMAVIDEWKNNLGVKAKVENLEWGLFSKKRFEYQPADYAGMFNFSWTSPYPDPINYIRGNFGLDIVWADGKLYKGYLEIQNDKSLDAAAKNKKMDEYRRANASPEGKRWIALKDQADKETDPAKLTAIYKEMAKLRLDAAAYIPMNYAKAFRVVKPHIKGYEMNPFLIGYPMYFRSIYSTK